MAGQSATETAALIMARLSTKAGDIAAAENYVKAIPAGSPGRILEELRIGQIFWFRYLKLMKETRLKQKPHEALRTKAKVISNREWGKSPKTISTRYLPVRPFR